MLLLLLIIVILIIMIIMVIIVIKLQLQNGVATAPRHWDRGGQHPPAGQSSSSHNL